MLPLNFILCYARIHVDIKDDPVILFRRIITYRNDILIIQSNSDKINKYVHILLSSSYSVR